MTQDTYPEAEPQAGATTGTLPAETATQRAAAEIRAVMGARRLNAVDLRPVLGLSRTAVTRRFNGDVDLTIDELEAIAAWLDVPLTRFIVPAAGADISK